MNMFEQMPFSEKYPVFRKWAEIGGSQFRESPIFFFIPIPTFFLKTLEVLVRLNIAPTRMVANLPSVKDNSTFHNCIVD